DHLLDLPDELHCLARWRGPDKDRQEQVQGQTGTVIERVPAVAQDTILSLKVALLTDGFPQLGSQMARIYDRIIPSLVLLGLLVPANVQLAGTMTPLAANGI